MEKYKLMKSYLGCAYKLNQIISTDIIWVNDKKVYLKDYPENWQEIVEYPIGTKAINTNTNCIITKKQDGWYKNEKTGWTDESINNTKGINILENKIIKKRLFCTEDGVDIYEGDGYWKVSANFNKSSVHSAKKTFRGEAINCNSKYFKTSKAAEKYILMNKPCLSIKVVSTPPKISSKSSVCSLLSTSTSDMIVFSLCKVVIFASISTFSVFKEFNSSFTTIKLLSP